MEAIMKTKRPKMNDVVTIPTGARIYVLKTDDELLAERTADRLRGDTLDSAGEPKLYCRLSIFRATSDTPAAVIATRNVYWPHWTKKPKGLVKAIVAGFSRPVLIADYVL